MNRASERRIRGARAGGPAGVVLTVALAAASVGLAGCGSGGDAGGSAETGAPGGDAGDTDRSEPVIDEQTAAARAIFADVDGADRPGCVAGVSVEGDVVFAEGFGAAELDTGEPITTDTRFDLASISKSFTAATVLVLAENGVVDLDGSLRTWLPELPETWDGVTVDHLLHHTGGVPPYEDELADQFGELAPTTTDDALAVLAGQPDLRFEPGTAWEYSNSGYVLLSLLVERATGEPFADVVASQVLEPVGLDDTFVRRDWSVPVEGGARGYADDGAGGFEVVESQWSQTGDGAVQSTVADLLAWAEELRTGGVLGEDVHREMQTPVVLADGTPAPYGAGLVLDEDGDGATTFGHEGAWYGTTTTFAVHPDAAVAGAVLCNIDGLDDIDSRLTRLLEIWSPG